MSARNSLNLRRCFYTPNIGSQEDRKKISHIHTTVWLHKQTHTHTHTHTPRQTETDAHRQTTKRRKTPI